MPIATVLAGATLLLAAVVWPLLHDHRDYWTEENAAERTKASNDLHGAACRLENATDGRVRESLEKSFRETLARYEESNAALANARDRYERPTRLLRLAGIVCLTLGAIGYVALRAGRIA